MKYHLIRLKAHAAGYANHDTYETATEVENAMNEYTEKYGYVSGSDFLVIKGDQISIEVLKSHRLR